MKNIINNNVQCKKENLKALTGCMTNVKHNLKLLILRFHKKINTQNFYLILVIFEIINNSVTATYHKTS